VVVIWVRGGRGARLRIVLGGPVAGCTEGVGSAGGVSLEFVGPEVKGLGGGVTASRSANGKVSYLSCGG